jgi:hypothetical protein
MMHSHQPDLEALARALAALLAAFWARHSHARSHDGDGAHARQGASEPMR